MPRTMLLSFSSNSGVDEEHRLMRITHGSSPLQPKIMTELEYRFHRTSMSHRLASSEDNVSYKGCTR